MSRLGDDGMVAPLTDREIETWAGWRGKRGAFAAFIREMHTDPEGRVNEWDEYQGALEHRRAVDRDRQRRRRDERRLSRGESNGSHAERPRDNRDSSAPARAVRNETKRDTTTPPPLAREDTSELDQWTPPSETAAAYGTVATRLASDPDRLALSALVDLVPNPPTWLAEIAASLDGMTGHAHVTPEQAGQAIRDFVGNGAAKDPNLRKFRRYLEQAANPEPPPSANGTRTTQTLAARFGGARNDAAIDATLPYLEAKYGK